MIVALVLSLTALALVVITGLVALRLVNVLETAFHVVSWLSQDLVEVED